MEENIGMWLELLGSGWQLRKILLQASTCSRYVGWWTLPNGRISSEYWSKSEYSATTILTNFNKFKSIVFILTLISKLLTNRWKTVGSESEIQQRSTVPWTKYPNRSVTTSCGKPLSSTSFQSFLVFSNCPSWLANNGFLQKYGVMRKNYVLR